MFGHLSPSPAEKQQTSAYHFHRQHYCGTCKVIGSRYGQTWRLSLNFDVVFLAELLSLLHNEATDQWQSAFQRINQCFAMPDKKQTVPFSLEYAAAVNVLLGSLKIEDNATDSAWRFWSWLRGFAQRGENHAIKVLTTQNIDIQPYLHWKKRIAEHEDNTLRFDTLEQALLHAAEPTAQLTAWAYANGVTPDYQSTMQALGYAFGQLVYALDAWQDIEKDLQKGNFNPLVQYWQLDTMASPEQQQRVIDFLQSRANAVFELLAQLPLPAEVLEYYSARLTTHILAQLQPRVYAPRLSWRQRWAQRWAAAKGKAAEIVCAPPTVMGRLRYYLVSIAVFVAPQATEQIPQEAKTGAWAWLAALTASLATLGLAGVVRRRAKRRKKKETMRSNPCKKCCLAGEKMLLTLLIIGFGVFALGFLIGLILFFVFGGVVGGIICSVFFAIFVVGIILCVVAWHDDNFLFCKN